MNRKLKAAAQTLLALVFLSLGIFLCAFVYRMTVTGLSGESWVTASSTITYTYSVRAWANLGGRDSGLEYTLYPRYSFVAADGRTFQGNQQSIYGAEKTYRSIESEDKLSEHLVVDGEIYYNPDDPRQSAVEQPYFLFILPLAFGVLAGIFLIGGIQIMRDTKRFYKKK